MEAGASDDIHDLTTLRAADGYSGMRRVAVGRCCDWDMSCVSRSTRAMCGVCTSDPSA